MSASWILQQQKSDGQAETAKMLNECDEVSNQRANRSIRRCVTTVETGFVVSNRFIFLCPQARISLVTTKNCRSRTSTGRQIHFDGRYYIQPDLSSYFGDT